MMRKFLAPVLALGLLAVAGCDVFDDDDDNVVLESATIRVLHASPDAPDVNVLIDGDTFVAGAPFKAGTGFSVVRPGNYSVQVDGITPGGTATVISADITLDADTETTVIAVGGVANIAPLLVTNERSAVAGGNFRATVVHAAPNAPAVDVYVTAPGADLSASAPLGSFSFEGSLGPVDVAAGDYQISVTVAGDATAIVFDSGTITIPDGANLLLAAVENTGPGASPISLVVLDGAGASEILDTNTPAALRVIHASPDAPAVDVVVNDGFAAPLIEDLEFPNPAPNAVDYVEVPAADYNVKVTVANDPGVIAIDADLTLDAGVNYSVYAVDFLANIAPLVLVDDPRAIATEARVRIVHASPTAQNVDIYVTAPGTDIATVDPTFPDVPFQAETGYTPLAGGTYTVTVVPAGTTTAAIGPIDITIADGGVYTAIARDPLPGSTDLGLILLDDFND
ncbi:MAG: DUF4397 domain-containing protein [Pseudomonadota bacterium]